MSETRLHVRPAEGLIVRDPDTAAALPAKGGRVANTRYWRRRLAAGDVIKVEPQTARKSKTSEG